MIGYIPRYIEFLLQPARCPVEDWGSLLLDAVMRSYGEILDAHAEQMEYVVLLSLTAEWARSLKDALLSVC